MSGEYITISKEEYNLLKKSKVLLQGYMEMNKDSDYPIRTHECGYYGCDALWLSDVRSRDYYINCQNMDFANNDCDDLFYCDKHFELSTGGKNGLFTLV